MFEPPILDQLMGAGALLILFKELAVTSNARTIERKRRLEKS